MRYLLFTLVTLLPLIAFSQTARFYKGQVFSIIDSLPLTNFTLHVNDQMLQTDSAGFFAFSTLKSKVKLSAHSGHYAYNRQLALRKKGSLIKLYCIKTYDSTTALYDIEQGTLWLFCGIAFAPMAVTQMDTAFEKRYNVHYYVIGDMIPFPLRDLSAYNRVITAYLDNKFGAGWQAEARADIVGFKRNSD